MFSTEEQFMNEYICPFEIDGILADEIYSLGKYYRLDISKAQTVEELREIIGKYNFLALDAKKQADVMSKSDFREWMRSRDTEETAVKYASIEVPYILMQAYLIAKEFKMPEYYAALQCFRVVRYGVVND